MKPQLTLYALDPVPSPLVVTGSLDTLGYSTPCCLLLSPAAFA